MKYFNLFMCVFLDDYGNINVMVHYEVYLVRGYAGYGYEIF